MRTLRLLVLPVLLIMIPIGAAQGPMTALEVHGGPATDVVSTRGVAIVSFNVTLRVANVVCTGSSSFAVDVVGAADQQISPDEGNATAANATVQVTPGSLNFPVGPGPYGSNAGLPAAQSYESTQTIAVAVESGGLPHETAYKVTVEASLRPASASNCRGSAAAPGAASVATFTIRFNETADVVPPSPELPTPWSLAPVAAALAVVAFRRRLA